MSEFTPSKPVTVIVAPPKSAPLKNVTPSEASIITSSAVVVIMLRSTVRLLAASVTETVPLPETAVPLITIASTETVSSFTSNSTTDAVGIDTADPVVGVKIKSFEGAVIATAPKSESIDHLPEPLEVSFTSKTSATGAGGATVLPPPPPHAARGSISNGNIPSPVFLANFFIHFDINLVRSSEALGISTTSTLSLSAVTYASSSASSAATRIIEA